MGGDLADAIETVLGGRGRQAKSYSKIAQELTEKGRLSGAPSDLGPTLAAAVRGDNARRISERALPRFREVGDEVRLSQWDLPGDAVRAGKDVDRAAGRQREAVRASLVKILRSLPAAGLLELVATWLNAQGVRSIRGVTSNVGEFDLAGTLHRGPEVVPVAIALFPNKQVDREHVLAIRGAAQHYGHAKAAWLISLGKVRDEAREEAQTEGAMPVAIFDGEALAASMEDVGVGIRQVFIPLATLDVSLLESLGDSSPSTSTSKSTSGTAERADAEAASDEDEDGARPARRRRGRRRSRGGRDKVVAETTEASSDSVSDTSDNSSDAPVDGEAPTEAMAVPPSEDAAPDAPVKNASDDVETDTSAEA